MILRRLGGRFGGGKGSGSRSDFRSADDGKRFVEVPSGTELRGTFQDGGRKQKVCIILYKGEGSGGGEGSGSRLHFRSADL